MASNKNLDQLAVVIIGRNEGKRLVDCFESIFHQTKKMVYVDSGSTDRSVESAQKLGIEVVALDMSLPFTAARARNLGFKKALSMYPETVYVQFVDGDCQVLPDWLSVALGFLDKNSKVAVVNGILNERFPKKTIYNNMCDLEWKMQYGEIKACGGNALMRVSAFDEENGFLPDLIAGEEPELCVRLRAKGWLIWHLNQNMMLHDANITHFSQWWRRTVRAGYAFAEGASIHGAAPEFHWVAESKRALVWGGLIPLVIIVLLLIKPILSFSLLLIYPLQVLRLTVRSQLSFKKALIQSVFSVIGKFAEMLGKLKYYRRKYMHQKSVIIEHK